MDVVRRDEMMEKKVISRFYHKHPLILKRDAGYEWKSPDCYGCCEPVATSEMAYICIQQDCSDGCILHKNCGELPNRIWHPKHSKHPMNLFYFQVSNDICGLCDNSIYNALGYRCSSCDFNVDKKCVEALIEPRQELVHPSHPLHPLTLMRRPAFSFYCDGCGDEGVDMAYACSTCEFLLHRKCASSLPAILPVDEGCHDHHHHHHQLFLVFSLPNKHRKYKYRCDVCSMYCDASLWAYFCDECRYIVHVKCAIGSSTSKPLSEDDGDVIELPLHANDIVPKLIAPFVMRVKGVDAPSCSTTTGTCGDLSLLLEYYHEHPLSLVSGLTHKDDEKEDDEEEEEDNEEELKICDVCVTPISSPPYYQCNAYACTYSLHSICSMLPPTLQYPLSSSSSSSSNSNSLLLLLGECNKKPNKNHNFTLNKSKGRYTISPWYCNLCYLPTNGMGYKCGDCGKMIDVKCASLPTTIRHASHTRCHHKPLILTKIQQGDEARKFCYVCNGTFLSMEIAYRCSDDEGCGFALHLTCALLPSGIKHRDRDKHPLMLTSDASLDHPSDFFCEFCEQEMHPKNWMYHCRHCDASFHLLCLDTGFGFFRNMKLGRRYEMDEIHPNHPLTFTFITLKKHCDFCRKREFVYTYLGYECASCYCVVCEICGRKQLYRKQEENLHEFVLMQ